MSQLYLGDNVWVTERRVLGKVTMLGNTPLSNFIQINNGVIHRYRYHLIPSGINDSKQIEPEKDLTTPVEVTSSNLKLSTREGHYITKSGHIVIPRNIFNL